jgi:three-Cys-motif partner protein
MPIGTSSVLSHEFGGEWTRKKLDSLRSYLLAYEKIFTTNEKAKYFTRTYFDAFAGTGSILIASLESDRSEEDERKEYVEGSAAVALSLPVGFHNYIFVERDAAMAAELDKLKEQFRKKSERIRVEVGDANDILKEWCNKTDWGKNRAIVFLDPYGMQVNWDTIVTIAKTKGIDLWLLFPIGQAVMRMLTNSGELPPGWSEKLTRFFGTDDWREAFYRKQQIDTLFGEEEHTRKTATFENIERYFVEKLEAVFAKVAKPMELTNSTGIPLYLLCFAASNDRGAMTAVKIANSILGETKSVRNLKH